jgi:hypothetical protein
MTKTIVCVGGPADGRMYDVPEIIGLLTVNYIEPPKSIPLVDENWNLFQDVIGWDDYGPIFNRHVKGAKYEIRGNEAVYIEKKESE